MKKSLLIFLLVSLPALRAQDLKTQELIKYDLRSDNPELQRLQSENYPSELSSAMEAYNRQDYSRAFELFENFYRYNGMDDELSSTAKYYAGESLVKMGQYQAALGALEYFVSRYPWSNYRPQALYRLGTLYFEMKDYSSSRERFSQLIDAYPQSELSGSAYYWIGETYSREDNNQDAISFFEEAIQKKKDNKFIDQSIYALANIYEKTGSYDKAVSYYDELLAYYKNSQLAPYAQVRIGLCYFMLKDYDNAVLELTDPIIEDLPEQLKTEARYVLGNAYYRLSEYNEAEKTYRGLLETDPASSLSRNVRYSLAWVYFQQEKYDDAFEIFTLLSKDDKDTIGVNSLFWSGEAKRYAGHESEALGIYQRFLDEYPQSPLAAKVRYLTGITHYGKKKTALSESYLKEAANSDDRLTLARADIVMGEIKLNAGDYKRARDYFESARKNASLPAELQNRVSLGLGVSLYYMDRFDQAISTLKELSNKSKGFESDKVHFYLAEAYFAAKDYPNALKNYNAISSSNSELKPQVIYGKAYAYFNMKDYVNSANYFSDYLKLNLKSSNFTDARLRLADSYYANKKYALASNIYRDIYLNEDARQNNDYAYYQYAQALYKAGNSNDAIREFLVLQEKFPGSRYVAESQYLVGWIYFQKGEYGRAIDSYRALLVRYPESNLVPVTMNSIGNSFFNQANYDSAVAYYKTVLTNYPNSTYSLEAVNGIKDAYIASGRTTEAVDLIESYASDNSKEGLADQLMFKKAELYFDLKDYQKAKDAYLEFIKAYPKSQLISEAHYQAGRSALYLTQREDAVYHFNIVYNSYLNSESGIPAVLELGRMYEDDKNYEAAIRVYQRVKEKLPTSPKLPEISFNKAMAHVENGDLPAAYEEFNFIIQNFDDPYFSSSAKVELALLEMARKSYENADMLLKEVSENNTDEVGAKAQYYYGLSLLEQDKVDDAISAFVRVKFAFSNFDEWLTKSFLSLGECYTRKGDTAQAREMYRIVLTRHKDDQYGQDAQTKLRALK